MASGARPSLADQRRIGARSRPATTLAARFAGGQVAVSAYPCSAECGALTGWIELDRDPHLPLPTQEIDLIRERINRLKEQLR